jgi:hypothetical protein
MKNLNLAEILIEKRDLTEKREVEESSIYFEISKFIWRKFKLKTIVERKNLLNRKLYN